MLPNPNSSSKMKLKSIIAPLNWNCFNWEFFWDSPVNFLSNGRLTLVLNSPKPQTLSKTSTAKSNSIKNLPLIFKCYMTLPKTHGLKKIPPSAFTSSPKISPISINLPVELTSTWAQSVKTIRIKNHRHSHWRIRQPVRIWNFHWTWNTVSFPKRHFLRWICTSLSIFFVILVRSYS